MCSSAKGANLRYNQNNRYLPDITETHLANYVSRGLRDKSENTDSGTGYTQDALIKQRINTTAMSTFSERNRTIPETNDFSRSF